MRPVLAILPLLACGGREPVEPAPPAPRASSLGDLLAEDLAAPEGPAALPGPAAAPPVVEAPACSAARQAAKEARADVDARRAALMEGLESGLAGARAALASCLSGGAAACAGDLEELSRRKRAADAAESRYREGLRRVGELEASLYPLDQAVDRECGRHQAVPEGSGSGS